MKIACMATIIVAFLLSLGACKKTQHETILGTYTQNDGDGNGVYTITKAYDTLSGTFLPNTFNVSHTFTGEEKKASFLTEVLDQITGQVLSDIFGLSTKVNFDYVEVGLIDLSISDGEDAYFEGEIDYNSKKGKPSGSAGGLTGDFNFKSGKFPAIFQKQGKDWLLTINNKVHSFTKK